MAQVIKSVSLNEKNEKDKKIIKHIARRNFSGYVKKLILEDIEKREKQIENTKPIISEAPKEKKRTVPTKQLSVAEKLELQKQKLNQAIGPAPFIKKQFRED